MMDFIGNFISYCMLDLVFKACNAECVIGTYRFPHIQRSFKMTTLNVGNTVARKVEAITPATYIAPHCNDSQAFLSRKVTDQKVIAMSKGVIGMVCEHTAAKIAKRKAIKAMMQGEAK